MSFVGRDWEVGHHAIEVGTVRAPGSPNRLGSRTEQHGYLIGSGQSRRLQLSGVYIVLPDGGVLIVKGSPSKRPRLVDPYTDEVVAATTSITGRERSSSDHSVHWVIESRCARSLGAWAQHTISMDRQIRSDRGTSLRWRDRARGDATRTMQATVRDEAGKEVLGAWTTHTSRKLGTSFRPLGTKMRGSFDGNSRALAPLSVPIVALTFHLVLNHGHAPRIGVFVVEG